MPKQNRISPTGQFIVTPDRGTLMGNRGILHNDAQEVVKPYAHKAWIICLLAFKGRRRQLMSPGKYTELFFLDEATALAAGHRPCFECRREAAVSFKTHWLSGNARLGFVDSIKVNDLDKVLHQERLTDERYTKDKRQRRYTAVFDTLPNGSFVLYEDTSHLVWDNALYPWTTGGYGAPVPRPNAQSTIVLTPRSTVAALADGYWRRLSPALPPK